MTDGARAARVLSDRVTRFALHAPSQLRLSVFECDLESLSSQEWEAYGADEASKREYIRSLAVFLTTAPLEDVEASRDNAPLVRLSSLGKL